MIRLVLDYSAHARQRMRRRRIAESEVEEALRPASVETRYPSWEAEDRIVVLARTDTGRRLKIVVLQDDEEFVVTVADRDSEE